MEQIKNLAVTTCAGVRKGDGKVLRDGTDGMLLIA